MKKITLKNLTILTLAFCTGVIKAAAPPPPVPPPPPGLPIDTNLMVLVSLCLVYAAYKFTIHTKKA